ncbi:hypothetical protein C1H46_034173 [Malus baccata]|uniref:FBD domain-containing protein n=1 Tax=Malus baccata TaxID=106549 RepID=A0A540L1F7_MALBA|nr:hypothetical protein C1H46_034173 [Malus baccata]
MGSNSKFRKACIECNTFRILSSVSTRDAVKTSVLSHRWFNVWPSVPDLSLTQTSPEEFSRFAGFVDRVLFFRGLLTLHCNDITVTPSSGCFSSLKFLHATVRYPVGDSMEKLISCCPVLEDLIIDGDLEEDSTILNFNVSAPNLKRLRISLHIDPFPFDGDDIYRMGDYYYKILVNVNAPNLEEFNLLKNFLASYSFNHANSLSKAKIDLGDLHVFNNLDFVHKSADRIYSLFAAIINVTHLSLSAPVFGDRCTETRCYLPTLNNLKHLELHLQACYSWQFLTKLLKISPCLEYLVIETNIKCSLHLYEPMFVHEWCPTELVPICLSSRVKTICIRGLHGQPDEMEVTKYLLKHVFTVYAVVQCDPVAHFPVVSQLPNTVYLNLEGSTDSVTYQLRLQPSFTITPPSNCFPSLKFLKLMFDCLDIDTMEKLISCCPVLEDLNIDCKLVDLDEFPVLSFNISALKLNKLQVYLYQGTSEIPRAYQIFVNVNAPSLKKFDLQDEYMAIYSWNKAKSLSRAKIDFKQLHRFQGIDNDYILESADRMQRLFEGLLYVKDLSVSAPLFGDPDIMHQYHLPTFNYLNRLELFLHTCCSWKLLTNFLKKSHNLKYLFLQSNAKCSAFRHGCDFVHHVWSPPRWVPVCLMSCLKNICIKGLRGRADEMEVVKYMLKQGEVLNNVIIFTCDFSVKDEMKLCQEMSTFPRASKACQIEFRR